MTVSENVDRSETAKFDRLASRWWDPDGESRPLHDLNPVRLAYVAGRVSLRGARVLDVGCGGGLLSEALAAAGADTVRMLRPDSMITKEYRVGRLNVVVDAATGRIVSVNCG